MALDAKTLFLPVLEEVNESAWREFESKYRAYRVRGGNEPMRSLLAPGVILLLEVYLPGEDLTAVSNEKLTEAFEGLYEHNIHVNTSVSPLHCWPADHLCPVWSDTSLDAQKYTTVNSLVPLNRGETGTWLI